MFQATFKCPSIDFSQTIVLKTYSCVYRMPKRTGKEKWTKAVWTEDGEEEEGTVPTCWVDKGDKVVRWPTHLNNTPLLKLYNAQATPEDKWERFPLVKVKYESG